MAVIVSQRLDLRGLCLFLGSIAPFPGNWAFVALVISVASRVVDVALLRNMALRRFVLCSKEWVEEAPGSLLFPCWDGDGGARVECVTH